MINRSVGFTLIEILVALVVIAIGMSAALKLSNQNIILQTELENRTYANWVAENLVIQMKLQKVMETGVIKGSDNMAGRIWYWQADIKPTFDADVLQLRMRVSIKKSLENTLADITAYLPVETT